MYQTCCRGNDTLRSVEAPTKLEPSLVTESLKTMVSLAQFLEEAPTVPVVRDQIGHVVKVQHIQEDPPSVAQVQLL